MGRIVGCLLGASLWSCTIDTPEYWVDPTPVETPPDEVDTYHPPPSKSPDAGASDDAGESEPKEHTPGAACVEGATRPCGPPNAVGTCQFGVRTCHDGSWGNECEGAVLPSERDCTSPLDNDCDGFPDNTLDGVCHCAQDSTEPCDTHPGFDGHGPCSAGERTCSMAADKQTSDWGECSGSVGPIPQDSCTVKGDDADCDGRPNGNCTCIEGDQVDCGPQQTVGICRKGKATCVNGKYGDCMDAVYPKYRDCRSALDNDCDGTADNTVDTVCTCAIGAVQACSTHPGLDGFGICKAGSQTCIAGANNRTSAFDACAGAVAPLARNCTSALDNNCDQILDNTVDATCACVIGQVSACDAHVGLDGHGICHAGQALCIAGPGNSSSALGACSGAVGPLPADSCTVAGDDSNCNGALNDGCQCVVSATCIDPALARCSAGVCVGCSTSADCARFPSNGVCSAGACVQCTAASAAACSASQVCDAPTNTCVAAPPPPVDPPVEPPVTP